MFLQGVVDDLTGLPLYDPARVINHESQFLNWLNAQPRQRFKIEERFSGPWFEFGRDVLGVQFELLGNHRTKIIGPDFQGIVLMSW